MAVRVQCITKDGGNHENPYVAIASLGWLDPQSGKTGRSTRVEMYDFVTGGGVAYVEAGGSRAHLIGAISSRGNKYVKTRADSTQADNLLRLPECS